MRLIFVIALGIICLGAAPKLTNDELGRQVVGVWQSPNLGDAQAPTYIRDTFTADLNVTSAYFLKLNGKLEPVKGEVSKARWIVQDGYVLIGDQHGKDLVVSAKRQIHVSLKGEVTALADWNRVEAVAAR